MWGIYEVILQQLLQLAGAVPLLHEELPVWLLLLLLLGLNGEDENLLAGRLLLREVYSHRKKREVKVPAFARRLSVRLQIIIKKKYHLKSLLQMYSLLMIFISYLHKIDQ